MLSVGPALVSRSVSTDQTKHNPKFTHERFKKGLLRPTTGTRLGSDAYTQASGSAQNADMAPSCGHIRCKLKTGAMPVRQQAWD